MTKNFKTERERLEKEIKELELEKDKQLNEHREIFKGCKKKTGYFEGSPYYCGDTVQTTPCDGFGSYCKDCQNKYKSFLLTHKSWDDIISYYYDKFEKLKAKLTQLNEDEEICREEIDECKCWGGSGKDRLINVRELKQNLFGEKVNGN